MLHKRVLVGRKASFLTSGIKESLNSLSSAMGKAQRQDEALSKLLQGN